jgi:4-amino-4-deoxy-L-arabinose transferase-like glycosyltransferase
MKILKKVTTDLFSKTNRHILILLCIIAVGFFFRFYNTPGRYGLDYDATRDAFISEEGAKRFEFPPTGPQSSLGPFYFGPWYYYQLILFTFISPFSYSPWMYVGILSVASIYLLYKIGEFLENKQFGLLLALICAVSPDQIGRATGLSNPNLNTFFAAVSILLFLKIIRQTVSLWWMLLFGFILGVGINNHFQMAGLLLFPVIILLLKKNNLYKSFVVILLGIFLAFIPLLAFDITHGWVNTKGLLYYLQYMRGLIYVPNRWLSYVFDFWPTFWAFVLGLPFFVGQILFFSTPFLILWLWKKKQLRKEFLFLFLIFSCLVIALRYQPGERLYHYYTFLEPFLFIFTGFFLWTIFKLPFGKYIGILLVSFLVLLPIPQDVKRLTTIDSQVVANKQINRLVEKYPNTTFNIYNCFRRDKTRIYALAVQLYYQKKLDDKGAKIGISYDNCIQQTDLGIIDRTLENTNAAVLKNVTDIQLQKSGWDQASPNSMYNTTVYWWENKK